MRDSELGIASFLIWIMGQKEGAKNICQKVSEYKELTINYLMAIMEFDICWVGVIIVTIVP